MKEMIVDPTVTYSYSQLLRDILRLKAAYPDLITSENAGFSAEGRQIPVITLGTGKTKVFFCATHHAREYIASAYLMYVINAYAEAGVGKKTYGENDMQALLAGCTAYFMPMVNPDGATLVQNGLKALQDPDRVAAMAMVGSSYLEWKANVGGVDLNRNYPALWELKNVVMEEPASELYNGEAPASEPEVRAVMRICKKNVFRSAVSFHTKGEVICWADAHTDAKIPGAGPMARRLEDVSGFKVMPPALNPGIYSGGFECWFRQEFLYPALLVKLTPARGGTVPHSDRDFFALACAGNGANTFAPRQWRPRSRRRSTEYIPVKTKAPVSAFLPPD